MDQRFEKKPQKFEGIMMKRRKWPLKGWHKRLFKLDHGQLIYAKSAGDINKGRYHGTIDIGLSVLTYKRRGCRIDIDADDLIYHLKVKSRLLFDTWLSQLREHRLYRQDHIQYHNTSGPGGGIAIGTENFVTSTTSPRTDSPRNDPVVQERNSLQPANVYGDPQSINRNASIKLRTLDRIQTKVQAWLVDSQNLQQCSKDLQKVCEILGALDTDLEKLYEYGEACSLMSERSLLLQPLEEATPISQSSGSKHQFRLQLKRTGLTKSARKARKSTNRLSVPVDAASLSQQTSGVHLSSSNPNLVSFNHDWPQTSITHDNMEQNSESAERCLRNSFISRAKEVHEMLTAMADKLTDERDWLKHAYDLQNRNFNTNSQVKILHLLAEAQKRNEDYERRLARIHQDSSPPGVLVGVTGELLINDLLNGPSEACLGGVSNAAGPPVQQSRTLDSSSIQEFFDAEEYLTTSGDSTEQSEDEDEDEVEEEEAASSEISEDAENTIIKNDIDSSICRLHMGRRSRLPAPKADTGGVSLWKLLCRNIGKDLSKISMPVTLNEPLNTLQRLCEELEYSELLDKANETDDMQQRMVLVAAFSVSAYGATLTRAAQKPFNPLLAETYECIREDKGWRFVSEQVSHHPPISSCHCESKNFIFWQDMRVKSKFWGKSMEIQPVGMVHVHLPKYNEHYTFNKVTTCIHNIYGDPRWVDHYGEVVISNTSSGMQCKLTYNKSSDKDHQVYGTVITANGETQNTLFGKWSEGLYCGQDPSAKCVWRPGNMPAESPLYYGFSRFAIELNEIDIEQEIFYAPTDSRFRPDQRLLENGDIQGAETAKLDLERSQRMRRKIREDSNESHKPIWFSDPDREDINVSSFLGTYWQRRKEPGGFSKEKLPILW